MFTIKVISINGNFKIRLMLFLSSLNYSLSSKLSPSLSPPCIIHNSTDLKYKFRLYSFTSSRFFYGVVRKTSYLPPKFYAFSDPIILLLSVYNTALTESLYPHWESSKPANEIFIVTSTTGIQHPNRHLEEEEEETSFGTWFVFREGVKDILGLAITTHHSVCVLSFVGLFNVGVYSAEGALLFE